MPDVQDFSQTGMSTYSNAANTSTAMTKNPDIAQRKKGHGLRYDTQEHPRKSDRYVCTPHDQVALHNVLRQFC